MPSHDPLVGKFVRWDNCLDEPGGHVADNAGPRKAGGADLSFDDVDVDSNQADRFTELLGYEFVDRDLEVLGEQLRKRCQIGYPTVGVVQETMFQSPGRWVSVFA